MDFDQLFKSLKEGVLDIASASFNEYKDEFKEDTIAFMNTSKSRLEKWTRLLKDGSIDKEDFEFLVMAQRNLFEMRMLKQAGLTKVKMDKLKTNVFKKIIQIVITSLPSLVL